MAFQIVRNDITKVSADAIVNTANPKPAYASGTDYAIYMAAGADALLEERKKIGDIEIGQARSTPAFALNAKYIIHTVGPEWIDGEHGEREAVRSCYENSLKLAEVLGCESIAFPLIATGVYGFPKVDALQIAVSVFSDFLTKSDMKVTLVVFDETSFVLSGKIFSGVDTFIDDNYVSEKLDYEYTPEEEAVAEDSLPKTDGSVSRRSARVYPAATLSQESRGLLSSKFKNAFGKKESAILADACACGNSAPAARSLDDIMSNLGETWQESLLRLIDEKGYTDTEVYKRANVDRKLFSKIRCNSEYRPKKITAVAFALALKLNLNETKDLLSRAGFALSPSSRFDLIIEYFINLGVYDTYTINLVLFEHKQPLLGA